MRLWIAVVGLAVAGSLASCAKQEPEPVYQISADHLDDGLPPGSLAATLSPAERAALSGQGYELEIDEDDRELMALAKAEAEAEEEPGGFGRAMDHVGKATVAIASVAISVGMVVAPFFLL
jgi:hypothetical protein